MADPKLNFADGVLINMAAYLVSVRLEPVDYPFNAAILADVIGQCSREVKFIDTLADATDNMLRHAIKCGTHDGAYMRAYYETKTALADCARWRMAAAYDAWKKKELQNVG